MPGMAIMTRGRSLPDQDLLDLRVSDLKKLKNKQEKVCIVKRMWEIK